MINTELALADLESAEKALLRLSKAAKGKDADAIALKQVVEKILPHLNEAKPLRALELSDDELNLLKPLSMLTLKPTMYIANVDEEGFENNPYLDAVKAIAEQDGSIVVPICNKLEAEIAELEDDERDEFLQELGMEEPGLNRVIRAGYGLLGLQTYFTAGPKEVRAWTIPVGATAPQSAGKIHTDFEKALSAPKLLATMTILTEMVSRGQKMPVNGALKAKTTLLKTVTLSTSALMSNHRCSVYS